MLLLLWGSTLVFTPSVAHGDGVSRQIPDAVHDHELCDSPTQPFLLTAWTFTQTPTTDIDPKKMV